MPALSVALNCTVCFPSAVRLAVSPLCQAPSMAYCRLASPERASLAVAFNTTGVDVYQPTYRPAGHPQTVWGRLVDLEGLRSGGGIPALSVAVQ